MVQTSTIVAASVGTVATGLVGRWILFSIRISKFAHNSHHSLRNLFRPQETHRSKLSQAIEERIEATSKGREGGSGSSQ